MFQAQRSLTRVQLALSLVGSFTLGGCAGSADDFDLDGAEIGASSQALAARSVPELPSPTLAVPEGNELVAYADATGVQIYACQEASPGSGYSWVFQAPEATLYDRRGRVVGQHFAGPTWEWLDHSKVVGTRLAGFTADPSAIPELLLAATPDAHRGRLAKVTFIQRLDTTGGLAPATGCGPAQAGQIARVDYTATYYFYEAAKRHCN
jgi:uncharacterized protein DUF3455